MDFMFVLFIIQGVVFGLFCSYIAKEKNRNGKNWFFLGFLFSILAIFALIAIPKIDKENEFDDSFFSKNSDSENKIKEEIFNKVRDISSSEYQLFLIKKFTIENNSTINKFVIGNDVFDTLEISLNEADLRYTKLLSIINENDERKRQRDNNLKEDIALEEKKRFDFYEKISLSTQKSNKITNLIGTIFIIVMIIIFFYYLVIDSKNKAESLSQKKAIVNNCEYFTAGKINFTEFNRDELNESYCACNSQNKKYIDNIEKSFNENYTNPSSNFDYKKKENIKINMEIISNQMLKNGYIKNCK